MKSRGRRQFSLQRVSALVACLLSAACEDRNPGLDPPGDRLFFPQGLLLDPRTPDGEAVRYLLVSGGNNNRGFNSGVIASVDLERFFGAWATDPDDDLRPYPFCEVDPDGEGDALEGRCVRDADGAIDARHPCRRLLGHASAVECDEGPFIVGE